MTDLQRMTPLTELARLPKLVENRRYNTKPKRPTPPPLTEACLFIVLSTNVVVPNMPIRLVEASEEALPVIARIAASAFHPETDALSRRLFPPHLQPKGIPADEAAYDWRLARKASSLASPGARLIVAIDEDKNTEDHVVGFALWDVPPAVGSDSGPTRPIECPALDKEAFEEMKRTVNQDAIDTFGNQGISGVWRSFCRPCST